MGFKNRNVRFYGLMTAFFFLFCISMCGCITITINECCQGPRITDGSDQTRYPQGKIWGYIKNNSGQPIANASITLTPGQGSGNSNSAGKYATGFLDYGDYTLKVTANGYQPGGGPVTVNGWTERRDYTLYP